jgi:hypothetical protein
MPNKQARQGFPPPKAPCDVEGIDSEWRDDGLSAASQKTTPATGETGETP